MAFVYQIQGDEQINALVRVIREAPESEILLRVPPESRALRNGVNLRLLRFYADQEGKSVVVVSDDVVVQRVAREVGLPCYAAAPGDVDKGQESVDSSGRPASGRPLSWISGLVLGLRRSSARAFATARQARPRWRHLFLIPCLFLVIAAVASLTAPVVTVEVTPVSEERDMSVSVPVSAGEVVAVTKNAPVNSEVEATGRRVVGLTAAHGVATFINQGEAAVTVPAGTEIGTGEGEVFRTTRSATVPARQTEYFAKVPVGLKAGRSEIPVVSVTPGSAGNIAEGRIRQIVGPLKNTLQVVNPEATRGGEDRTLVVATADDVARAVAALQDGAELVAKAEATRVAPAGTRLIPESVGVTVEEVATSPEPGVETRSVKATGMAVVAGRAFKEGPMLRKAVLAARSEVPKGWIAVDEPRLMSIGFPGGGREGEPGRAIVRLVLSRAVRADSVVSAARGRARAQAEAAVRSLPGIKAVRVLGGGKRLPSWGAKIKVTVRDGPV